MSSSDKPSMNWQAQDLHQEWKRFKQHCEFTFGGPLSGKTEKEKVSYLMTYIGDKGREVYLTFDWRTITLEDGTRIPENDTLEGVYRHYEAYVKPKKNQIRATVNFHRRKQKEGERFHDFVTDLKLLVRDCGYDDNDRMMRDAIVLNALSQDVRQKCLERGDELTLDMAINIGQTSETAQESIRAIDQEVDKVHALRASHKRGQTKPSHQGRPQKGKFKGQNPSKGKHSKPNDDKCKRCGYHANHPKCPAIGQLCAICKKPNHFAAVCRKGTHTHMVVENETASTPDEGLDDESGQDYAHLFAVSENESQGHSATTGMRLFQSMSRSTEYKLIQEVHIPSCLYTYTTSSRTSQVCSRHPEDLLHTQTIHLS